MTLHIAELDEDHRIAAVWIREKSTLGPSVFDPRKHRFDPVSATGFLGAPQEQIEDWIAGAQTQGRASTERR